MMYIYDHDKLDELLETVKDDDSITLTGRDLRELAETIRKKILCYLRYPIPAASFLEFKLKDRSKRIIDKHVIKRALEERDQAAVEGC